MLHTYSSGQKKVPVVFAFYAFNATAFSIKRYRNAAGTLRECNAGVHWND